MIEKIIHYCWFGNGSLPLKYRENIRRCKNLCPDFSYMIWTEDNCNYKAHLFTRKAHQLHNWAAVSDYIRLKALEDYGGVYMDEDVKLLKDITPLLKHKMFLGLESPYAVSDGLMAGACIRNNTIKQILKLYDKIAQQPHFKQHLNDASYILTAFFRRHGLKYINTKQTVDNCVIYPTQYFCPKRLDKGLKTRLTPKTYSIHEYDGNWSSQDASNRHHDYISQFNSKVNYYLDLMNKK